MKDVLGKIDVGIAGNQLPCRTVLVGDDIRARLIAALHAASDEDLISRPGSHRRFRGLFVASTLREGRRRQDEIGRRPKAAADSEKMLRRASSRFVTGLLQITET